MSYLKKFTASWIAIVFLVGLTVSGAQTAVFAAEETGLVSAAETGQTVWSETEEFDYDAMTVTTSKIFIDDFLDALSVSASFTLAVLDETGAVKTRGEIFNDYKLSVTGTDEAACVEFDIIQTVQGIYSLTSKSYKINEKAQTISGIPYSDMRIEDFLSNLEITPDMTVEVLRPDMSPLYGDIYPECLLRAYTIYEEHIYTLLFNSIEVKPDADLALNKPVTGKEGTWQYPPSNLTNGVTTGSNMWGAKVNGAYAEIDLGASVYFNKIRLNIHQGNSVAFRKMYIYCSDTKHGENDPWPDSGEAVASIICDGVNGVPEEWVTFELEEPKCARYIALVHEEKQSNKNPWIREVEVYATENYNCGVSSDKYSVDNQNTLISEVDTTNLSEILSHVSPMYGSTLSIVDADGNEISGEYQEGCAVRCMSESGVRYQDYVISTNLRPRVTNLTVTGSMGVGQTLTAYGEYFSPSGLPQDRIDYRWCRSVNAEGPFIPIQGAEGEDYTIRSEDAGYYLCVEATAYSTEEPAEGIPAFSSFCGLVGDYAFGSETQVGGKSASALVDGDAATDFVFGNGDSLSVDLGSAQEFNHILLSFSEEISDAQFVVDYSQDGTRWERLSTLFGREKRLEAWFETIRAQYIRIGVSTDGSLPATALTVNQARQREAGERAAFELTKQMLSEYFSGISGDTAGFVLPYLGINGAALSWSSNSSCFSLNGEKVTVNKPETETRAALTVQIVTPYQTSTETYTVLLNGSKKVTIGMSGGGGGGSTGGKDLSYKAPVKAVPVIEQQSKNAPSENLPFGDIDAHWAKEDIVYLYTKGILSQNEEETFRPDTPITRAEFAKLSALLMGWEESGASLPFADVPSNAWSRKYISALYDKGIIQGINENYFGAEEAITRQDAAVILYRAQLAGGKQFASGENSFTDSDKIAAYAMEAVSAMAKQGILKGDENGAFAPNMDIKRAEAAAIIARLLRN